MRDHNQIIAAGVFTVLVFTWLGFLLHVSPRFAGSGIGAAFAISAAGLFLVPLAYVIVKRIPALKDRTTKYVSLRAFMSVHIYTGIAGSFLALIHTGHKYNSPVGIALTATMLLVIVTGFVLRYLTPFVNLDVKEKLLLLQTARGDLDCAWGVLEKSGTATNGLPKQPLLAVSDFSNTPQAQSRSPLAVCKRRSLSFTSRLMKGVK